MLRSTIRISRKKYCAILDSSQSNNASWKPTKEILQTSIRKCLDQISLSDTPKLSSLTLSLILENGWHASLPLKVFRTESQGEIPVRGEGYNTPGVCHQLSNGFELKYDMLSGDEGVKIKSTRVSSNLNLGNTHLLAYWPFSNIYLSNDEGASFICFTSISTHMDDRKSFVKFGIKKSHEMTSYVLAWIVL